MSDNQPVVSATEEQKQQLDSTAKTVDAIVDPSDLVASVNAIAEQDEEIDDGEPASILETSRSSLVQLLENATTLKLNTNLLLTLSPRSVETLPEVLVVDNKHYLTSSPFRNGSAEADSPIGFIRPGLTSFVERLAALKTENVTLIGSADDLAASIDTVCRTLESELNAALLTFNNGSAIIEFPADSSDDDASLEEVIETNETDSDALFVISVNPSMSEGSNVLDLNVHVNVLVPMLSDSDNTFKVVAAIHKMLRTHLSLASPNENIKYRTALVLDSSSLLDPRTRTLLDESSSELIVSDVVGLSYFTEVLMTEEDHLNLFNAGLSVEEALSQCFYYGGDMLLVFSKITPASKAVSPAGVDAPAKKKKKKLRA